MPEFQPGGRGGDPSGSTYQVWRDALALLSAAATDGRAFRRLVVVAVLAALLVALACLLVIVWRAEWPHLAEGSIPVLPALYATRRLLCGE